MASSRNKVRLFVASQLMHTTRFHNVNENCVLRYEVERANVTSAFEKSIDSIQTTRTEIEVDVTLCNRIQDR